MMLLVRRSVAVTSVIHTSSIDIRGIVARDNRIGSKLVSSTSVGTAVFSTSLTNKVLFTLTQLSGKQQGRRRRRHGASVDFMKQHTQNKPAKIRWQKSNEKRMADRKWRQVSLRSTDNYF
jgi:hypothetical protein